MRKLAIFFIIFTYTISIYGGVSAVGTTAAPFLEIEVGSRAIGMGGAFTAVADDANAIYWNPAGLARIPRNEIAYTHTEWLVDFDFDFAGSIFNLGPAGLVGLSFTSLSMPDMEVRTIEEPEGTGELFSAGSIAIGLTYSRALTDRFSIGTNVKYIQEKIWHMSSSSIAIDFGTLFITYFNDLKIGMSISNFGTDMQLTGRDAMVYHDIDESIEGNNEFISAYLSTDRWPLPLVYRVGLAMDLIKERNNRLTVAVDAVHPNNDSEYLNLGMEWFIYNLFFLRTGYSSLRKDDITRIINFGDDSNGERDSENGLTFGVGIRSSVTDIFFEFDYAYAAFGRLGDTHRASISFSF